MTSSFMRGAAFFGPSPSIPEPSLEVRHLTSPTNSQAGEQWAYTAGNLLLLAVQEEIHARQQASQSWAHQVFGSGHAESNWASYLQKVQAILRTQELNINTVQSLAEAAPKDAPPAFHELVAVLGGTNEKLLMGSMLHLAQRNLQCRQFPTLTRALLSVAARHPSTAEKAKAQLQVLEGGGSFSAQLEYQAPQIFRELASPLALASFGSALWVSRATSLAVLSRATRLSLTAFVASEGAAFALEVPTLVLTRRLGMAVFAGAEATPLAHDLLMTCLPFAFLKVGGHLFTYLSPILRNFPLFHGPGGQLNLFGHLSLLGAKLGMKDK